MAQGALSRWLKIMIIGLGICGAVIYAAIIPSLADAAAEAYPEFSGWRPPWLVLIWITAVPCYIVLVFAWRIAANIGRNRSFTAANAKYLSWISVFAAADCTVFFCGKCGLSAAWHESSGHRPALLAGGVFRRIGFRGLRRFVASGHEGRRSSDAERSDDIKKHRADGTGQGSAENEGSYGRREDYF